MKTTVLFTAAILVASMIAATTQASLVGYWQFEGNNDDYTGNYDMTGGSNYAAGLFGQSLYVDDTAANGVNRPQDDNVFDFGSNDFSMQFWVYYDAFPAATQTFAEKIDLGGPAGWSFALNTAGTLGMYGGAAPGPSFDSTGTISAVDTWHQVVLTRDGSLFSMYIDGALDSTDTDAGAWAGNGEFLRFGTLGGSSNELDGRLDEVAFWNHALNLGNVQALWNDGLGLSLAVPEPASMLLVGLGSVAMLMRRRRRN